MSRYCYCQMVWFCVERKGYKNLFIICELEKKSTRCVMGWGWIRWDCVRAGLVCACMGDVV